MKKLFVVIYILSVFRLYGSAPDSVYIKNQSKSISYYNYTDFLNKFRSFSCLPEEGKWIKFNQQLLLTNAKSGDKYLVRLCDTIILNDKGLSYQREQEDLQIMNHIASLHPPLNLYNTRDFYFLNFVKNNSFDEIKRFLTDDYESKKMLVLQYLGLNEVYRSILLDHYYYEYINSYIQCIFYKLKDSSEILFEIRLIEDNFDDDNLIFCSSYRSSIVSLVAGYSIMLCESQSEYQIHFIEKSLQSLSKEFALFYFTSIQLNRTRKDFMDVYKATKELIANEVYVDYLEEIKKSLSDSLLEVNQFISCYDGSFLSVENMLKVFKGKYIVMDICASWCAPCVESFPFTRLIEKAKHDVVFLYVSIDKDINQWKLCIKQNNLPLTQSYFLVGGMKSDFAKLYNVQSIPRYLIYDKNGKIINQNAVFPVNDGFEKQLNELLRANKD